MSQRPPSCHLTTDQVDLHNPAEAELLASLRAVAARRDDDLRLAKAAEEFLEARAGSVPGMLRVRKRKGAGREYLRARRELSLAEAEATFAAYLAGEPDFDRGIKWEVIGLTAGRGARILAATVVLLVALALLWRLGFRVIRVG